MFHVVQVYDRHDDYTKATVVASLETAEAAWEYLDSLHARMARNSIELNFVSLVVVDAKRQPVLRPRRTVS